MASIIKSTRGSCNNLFEHYERKEGIKFKNQEIDKSKSYLNYNLAPIKNLTQNEILNKRLSEVKVLKRKDVNVICSWVVTLPKTIEINSREEKEFFEETYKFLKNEYGEKNIISSYVHKDEVTPHMHFCFVPVVIDKKKNIEKVSAKELITKEHLKTFHNRLDRYLSNYFKREIGILNGATENGNKTVLELKNIKLQNKIKDKEKDLLKIEKMILTREYENKKFNKIFNKVCNMDKDLLNIKNMLNQNKISLENINEMEKNLANLKLELGRLFLFKFKSKMRLEKEVNEDFLTIEKEKGIYEKRIEDINIIKDKIVKGIDDSIDIFIKTDEVIREEQGNYSEDIEINNNDYELEM